MATKKDLVEAYSFSRRRLVTAFLSGAPGGREVEPSRPGRTVVGGLALAVLLVAGAAIASVLASRTEEDWNKVGLVVSRQEAAPYVILDDGDDPTLIPVINITSAQLILGADVEPTYVDQDVIEDQTPGDPIGIAGAPQTLPRPKQFIESGWTACTDAGVGIAVDVSNGEHVSVRDNAAIVVHSADAYWLVARSPADDPDRRYYRYQIPEGTQDPLLNDDLGLTSKAEAIDVPPEWIALFPEGGELGGAGFDLPDGGAPLASPPAPDARVGDYAIDGDRAVMFTNQGSGIQPLDPFALDVLKNSKFPGHRPARLAVPIPNLPYEQRSYATSHWPVTIPTALNSPPCARLDVDPDHVPHVDLAGDPEGDAASPPEDSENAIPATERRVTIDRGHGAFVRVGSWDETSSGSAFVIDPRGKAYALVGALTLAKLGYDATAEPLVPDEWLELFDEGVALSTSAALCPPANQPGEDAPSPETCQDPPQ
jgi:type VII secretion protein EccB